MNYGSQMHDSYDKLSARRRYISIFPRLARLIENTGEIL